MKKILIAIVAVSTIATSAMAEGHKGADKDRMHRGEGMGKIMKNLPQEKQDQIKVILEKSSNKEEVKALVEQRKQILSAEKFDKAAYIKNSEKMKDLREKAHDNRIKTHAEILSILTPEQRIEFDKGFNKKKSGKNGMKDRKKKD